VTQRELLCQVMR